MLLVPMNAKVSKDLDSMMNIYTQYAAHLLSTKHQRDYKFTQDNLQPGEAIVIIDYKMKLELGVRTREILRDWYGKRGIPFIVSSSLLK